MLYESQPSMGMLGYWTLLKILPYAVIVMGTLATLSFLFNRIGSGISLMPYYLGFGALILLYFLYQILLIKSHTYFISDKYVGAKAGVISHRQREIPFNKITDVTISQNIFERMFGISNLQIQTASMGGRPEISFMGITDAHTPKKIILKKISK